MAGHGEVADEAKCSCGNGEETIRHLILSCPRWTDERKELSETVGARSGDASYLLGGWGSRKDVRTGQLLDGPKEKWKSDIEVVKATIRFLRKTGRLNCQLEAEWATIGMDHSHSRAKAANFFCKQGHSLGTAHTVTVNSLTESINQ
jgi:hypothetical protein